MATWDLDREERMVELWEARPPLFNTTLKAYSCRTTKDRLIGEMSAELGVPGKLF